MGEEIIAPDWWSLWVIKAKCLKVCIDEDAWLFEQGGYVCEAHMLLAVYLQAFHLEEAIV